MSKKQKTLQNNNFKTEFFGMIPMVFNSNLMVRKLQQAKNNVFFYKLTALK